MVVEQEEGRLLKATVITEVDPWRDRLFKGAAGAVKASSYFLLASSSSFLPHPLSSFSSRPPPHSSSSSLKHHDAEKG